MPPSSARSEVNGKQLWVLTMPGAFCMCMHAQKGNRHVLWLRKPEAIVDRHVVPTRLSAWYSMRINEALPPLTARAMVPAVSRPALNDSCCPR